MLKFDSLPPQPGQVQFGDSAKNLLKPHLLTIHRDIGSLTVGLLVELNASDDDVVTIVHELADTLSDQPSKTNPREFFLVGAKLEAERLGLSLIR